jgi:hypothetical protein
MVQGQPRQVVCKTLIFKITRAKWTGGVTQAVEHLLCKRKALSSKPQSHKKRQKKLLTRRLNNTLLDNKGDIKEIRGGIKKLLDSNENENKIYQNLWNTAKSIAKRNFYSYEHLP